MAGPHPIANTVELVLRGDRLGHEIINTFFFRYAVAGLPVTLTDLDQLASLFVTSAVPYIAACMHSDCRWTDVNAIDRGSVPFRQVDHNITTPIVGSRGATCMPGNVSIGVRRLTGLHGRSYHGRIELPPPGINDVVRDIIGAGLQLVITTLLTQLLTVITTGSGKVFTPAVGSEKLVSSTDIVSWLFNSVSDSQKTRLIDHGA